MNLHMNTVREDVCHDEVGGEKECEQLERTQKFTWQDETWWRVSRLWRRRWGERASQRDLQVDSEREGADRWVIEKEHLYISLTEHLQREFITPGQFWPSWSAAQTQKCRCRWLSWAGFLQSLEPVLHSLWTCLVKFLNKLKEFSWCPVELWTPIPAENKENVILLEQFERELVREIDSHLTTSARHLTRSRKAGNLLM